MSAGPRNGRRAPAAAAGMLAAVPCAVGGRLPADVALEPPPAQPAVTEIKQTETTRADGRKGMGLSVKTRRK